jgi:hypothetical protein
MVVLRTVFFRCCNRKLVAALLSLTLTGIAVVWADEPTLLDQKEYRLELEEVVVVGQKPAWRQPQKPEWRPDKFKLPQQPTTARMEWFPRYTKDERDNYDGIRDRMGEKAEFQIFKWKF